MGIYDRDYYRRDGRSFLGSLTSSGTVCWWLIGINAACFLVQLLTVNRITHESGWFTELFQLDLKAVRHGEVWRLLTYAFLHGTSGGFPWHIVFNMLFLYFFGRDVEDAYGPREFLAFYLTAAFIGGVAFFLVPLEGLYCIGASGAVTAVMVLAAFREPTRVILLFMVLPVPIWLLVGFLVVKDAFQLLGNSETSTAVQVHLAGAAFAFLYFKFQWRVTGWWPGFKMNMRRMTRPKLRVYREEPDDEQFGAPVNAPVPSLTAVGSGLDDEQLEAKVDAILEKISRVGKENITESEREVLLRASERIRRRRG